MHLSCTATKKNFHTSHLQFRAIQGERLPPIGGSLRTKKTESSCWCPRQARATLAGPWPGPAGPLRPTCSWQQWAGAACIHGEEMSHRRQAASAAHSPAYARSESSAEGGHASRVSWGCSHQGTPKGPARQRRPEHSIRFFSERWTRRLPTISRSSHPPLFPFVSSPSAISSFRNFGIRLIKVL